MDSFEAAGWRKSSFSDAQNNCVETARIGEVTGVRDSKDRDGAVLIFGQRAWTGFLAAVRAGRFD